MADEQYPAPAESSSETEVEPVPAQPPEQLSQTQNPEQISQKATEDRNKTAADQESEEDVNPRDRHSADVPFEPIDAGEGLEAIAKRIFFVADDAGESELVMSDAATAHLHFEDGSTVTARFEVKPGRFGAVGPRAINEAEGKARNKAFANQKKLDEDRIKAAGETKKSEAEAREKREGSKGKFVAEKSDQPQNVPTNEPERVEA